MDSELTLQRILIIDDDSDYRKLLVTWLGKLFPEVEVIEYDPLEKNIPDEDFDWSGYDVLLLDYNLRPDDVTGLDILAANYNNENFPQTIMLTSAGSEEIAVRAFKYEVRDYLRKEWLDKEQLGIAVENAFSHKILLYQRTNMLKEARQIAKAESEKQVIELELKYIQGRLNEEELLFIKHKKIERELHENRKILEKIEQERAEIEKSKKELDEKIETLKKERNLPEISKDKIDDQLESTNENLIIKNSELERIKQDHEKVEATIEKIRWQQDQEETLVEQKESLSDIKQELEDLNNKASIEKTKKLMAMLERLIEIKQGKID